MSLIRGSYPNYRRTSYKQKQKIPLKMGKEPEKRFFQKIINGPLPPLIVILSQLKKCSHYHPIASTWSFRGNRWCVLSQSGHWILSVMFGCRVWFRMGMRSKSVQTGKQDSVSQRSFSHPQKRILFSSGLEFMNWSWQRLLSLG